MFSPCIPVGRTSGTRYPGLESRKRQRIIVERVMSINIYFIHGEISRVFFVLQRSFYYHDTVAANNSRSANPRCLSRSPRWWSLFLLFLVVVVVDQPSRHLHLSTFVDWLIDCQTPRECGPAESKSSRFKVTCVGAMTRLNVFLPLRRILSDHSDCSSSSTSSLSPSYSSCWCCYDATVLSHVTSVRCF